MKRPVLLDIDADFMVGNADGQEEDYPDVTGREYGRYLRRFKKKGTKVHLMVDHHESLYHWDQAGVKDALCIHVDAHHDMWYVEEPRKPIVEKSLVDFRDPRRGLRTPEQVDCGNYLQQAMIDGIVKDVIYVPAPFRKVRDERDDINDCMEEAELQKGRVRIQSWERFKEKRTELPKADIITIAVSPEWTPKSFWREIQDLCDTLRVRPDMVRSIRRKSNKKWKAREGVKSAFVETNLALDFKFPYRTRIV